MRVRMNQLQGPTLLPRLATSCRAPHHRAHPTRTNDPSTR